MRDPCDNLTFVIREKVQCYSEDDREITRLILVSNGISSAIINEH